MSAKTISHNVELVRRTVASLRSNWIASPVFELLAFRRFAEYLLISFSTSLWFKLYIFLFENSRYIDDDAIRRMLHPPSFAEWNVLAAYAKLIHSPYASNIDLKVQYVHIHITYLLCFLFVFELIGIFSAEKLQRPSCHHFFGTIHYQLSSVQMSSVQPFETPRPRHKIKS